MHPVLFELPTPFGTFPIYSYGVMLGSSLVAAWFLVMHLGVKREGLSKDVLANTFIITAVSAFLGARVLYIVTNLSEFSSPGQWVAVNQGGLVAYGGFLGGLAGAYGYLRAKKVSLLSYADVVAPTLGLGLGLTRIGCYLFGCDFGRPMAEGDPSFLRNWGTFPRWDNGEGSPAWVHHVQEYQLERTAEFSLPVHPTQIYESAVGFILFGVTLWVWRKRQFRGQVILTLTALYGIWRFFVEFVRDDPERGFFLGVSTSQWISVLLVPFAIFTYQQLRMRALRTADAPNPEPAEKKTKRKKRQKRK